MGLLTARVKGNPDPEDFRKAAAEMAAKTWNKDGTRFYQYFLSAPDLLEYIETFSNSQTALAHLTNQDKEFLAKWFTYIELASCRVVGPATEELKSTVKSLVAPITAEFFETMGGYEPRG